MTDTILGEDITTNKPVTIKLMDRRAGMLVIGRTGSGKSWFIENMAVQDIAQGMGVCIIEPAGSLINKILPRIPKERYKDVILLWPEDEEAHMGLNIYACANPGSPRMVAYTLNNVMDTFEKLYDMSRSTPRMAQVMRNIALTMIHNPSMTLVDVPHLLSNQSFRQRLASNAPPNVQLFWQNYDRMKSPEQWELTESTQNKIDEFVNDPLLRPIFGQSKTSINFRECMERGKILLIHLTAELPGMTDLLGSIIIGQLLIAALSRDPMKNPRQFNLYVDEFQRFLTPSMNTLLVEARKYSIATCVAHQVREQLDEVKKATTIQARSLVVFSVTGSDAQELAGEFNYTPIASTNRLTIPSDVLYHLTDHPSEVVKEFDRIIVRRMLEAKAMPIKEEHYKATPLNSAGNTLGMGMYEKIDKVDKIYPRTDFGEGEVEFNPDTVRKSLPALELLLYKVMKGVSKDMTGHITEEHRVYLLLNFFSIACSFAFLTIDYLKTIVAVMRTEPNLSWEGLVTHPNVVNHADHEDAQQVWKRFWAVCDALEADPIMVSPSTGSVSSLSQQSYSDRKAQIANELTHLKVGHARVRIPDGEFTIRTLDPKTPKEQRAKWPEIRKQLLEQTRNLYCKTLVEVEEEIRQRQMPPPPTQRKHPIE